MPTPDANAPQPLPWNRALKALVVQLDELVRETVGYSLPPVEEVIDKAGPGAIALGDYCTRCGDSIGEGEVIAGGCVACRDHTAIGDHVVRLGSYEDSLRELVLAVKFQKWWEMGRTLGRMLGDRVAADVQLKQRNAVVVPVPMPWQRRLYRGIDHARVIASGVAEAVEAPMWSVLSKVNGAPQLALQPSARHAMGGRGLRVRHRMGGWDLAGRDVVLVDDVRTTGATLRRAVKLLRGFQPARIVVAVVAVADDSARRARSAQTRALSEDDVKETAGDGVAESVGKCKDSI